MSEFSQKVALVSGGASGIGFAVIEKLLREESHVYCFDIKRCALCPDVSYIGDVTKLTEVNAAVDDIVQRHGRVDYLVNCAGVLYLESILESSEQHWMKMFAVNLHGAVGLCRKVAAQMKKQGGGNVVLISSNAASVPRLQMAGYCASKAALSQFGRCLALEMAPYGIRCNTLAPGSTLTDMQKQLWENDDQSQDVIDGDLQQYRLGIPLGRLADPEDIAESVLFLLSSRSKHITMETLTVDGGATLGAG